jgi:hypothetical protein
MCEPKSRQFIVNFMPASIENLDVEGKQKACTPDDVPLSWNRYHTIHANSSNNTFASCKSAVSNPSVNQV